MSVHSLVEILDVIKFPKHDSELLWGFNLETPDKSYETDKYEIFLSGWVLGKTPQVVAIEIISNGILVQQVPVNHPRPDVLQAYPDVPFAETCGFLTTIAVREMPTETELLLQALFSDYNRSPIGIIKFRKNLPFLERVQKDLEQNNLKLIEFQQYLKNS